MNNIECSIKQKKTFQTILIILEHSRSFKTILDHFRPFQNILEHSRMFQKHLELKEPFWRQVCRRVCRRAMYNYLVSLSVALPAKLVPLFVTFFNSEAPLRKFGKFKQSSCLSELCPVPPQPFNSKILILIKLFVILDNTKME